MELVAAAAVTYLVRKAGRVGRRADEEVDRALNEGMDRLHDLIGAKLGADPVLDQLAEQAGTGVVTERTERRVALAVVDAAEADQDFAARLQEMVEALQRREGGERGGAGSVHNLISGGIQHGTVVQGRDFGTVNLGAAAPVASDGESPQGKDPSPVN
ncbi:hypothetical protein ABZ153_09730 [Streptomyces sp. NPDC006290]|uniref:hypothetical protein n=1 Tax=Streptomyces sp. NPDC006290 TaxID=3156745 RepID=UPI0033B0AD66